MTKTLKEANSLSESESESTLAYHCVFTFLLIQFVRNAKVTRIRYSSRVKLLLKPLTFAFVERISATTI